MDFFMLILIVENLNNLIKYHSIYEETRPTHYPNKKGSSLYNIARIVFNLYVLLALFDWVTSPNHIGTSNIWNYITL